MQNEEWEDRPDSRISHISLTTRARRLHNFDPNFFFEDRCYLFSLLSCFPSLPDDDDDDESKLS